MTPAAPPAADAPARQDDSSLQYNTIGASLLNYKDTPAHKVEVRNMMRLVGDVRGKSVLDLACGYGLFSLEYKKNGAASVVGADISAGMLNLAREKARQAGLAVEYHLGDGRSLNLGRRFDIISAVFFFNYAQTARELEDMFKTAAKHLRRGGRLIACTVNPDCRLSRDDFGQYCVKILELQPLNDDVCQTRVTFDGTEESAFTCWQWSRRAYEKAIANVGFKALRWRAPQLLPADIAAQPPGFWDIFQKNGLYIYFTCTI